MCGIVGAVAERNVTPILLEGLRRLEYRGYDSAGIAVLDKNDCISRVRRVGKVKELADALQETEVRGVLGIAQRALGDTRRNLVSRTRIRMCVNKVRGQSYTTASIENHSQVAQIQSQ